MTVPLPLHAKPRALVPGAASVSPLGLGLWRVGGSSVEDISTLLETALDVGITLVDTAEIYGFDGHGGFGDVEVLLGETLRRGPHLRERLLVATKGGITPGVPYDSSGPTLTRACEASLRRLGVETIDLYQVHRPDLLTAPDALAETLDALWVAGKIRSVGVSNFTAAQATALSRHLRAPFVSVQPEFSPLAPGILFDGVLDQAVSAGLAVLAWSPFAGGRLAGGGDGPRAADVVARLDAIAHREGVTRAAVAYAWVLAHPARIVPLVGTRRPDRLREAAAALRVHLDRAEWYGILSAGLGHPLP